MVYCAGKVIENLKLFYKSNRPHFLWVYWRDNPLQKLLRPTSRNTGTESHQIRPETFETFSTLSHIKQSKVSRLIFKNDAFRNLISDKRHFS